MSNPHFKRRRRVIQDRDQLQSIVDGYDSIQLNADTTITGNLIISGSISAGSIAHTLNDISDVIITSVTTNDVLAYNGSNWINGTTLTLSQLTNSKYIYATNLLIGDSNTGSSLTSGANNILIGDGVAQNISTHSNNTMIGKNTGNAGTNLYNNVIIGNLAGSLGLSFAGNVLIGYNCFPSCAGNANTIIGANTCGSLTNDGSNTVVGSSAMSTCLPGSHDCSIFGANALSGTAGVNVRCNCFGSLVMSNATDADDNCFFGNQIADSIVNGANQNVAMGNYAMQNITTLAGCVAIGYKSLNITTDGALNSTSIGFQSQMNSNAIRNSSVGSRTLETNTTGRDNCAFGNSCMLANVDGGFNSSYGSGSLNQNVSGYNNCAFGYNALTLNTVSDNTAFGTSALATNSSGPHNTAVGTSALSLIDTNGYCTALGYNALKSCTGASNSGFGCDTLFTLTTGERNTAIGHASGYAILSGSDNVGVGWESLRINSTGINNTAVGNQSLRNNTANYNTAVGFQSLYTNSSGEQNSAFGYKALSLNQTNSYNTACGYQSLVQSVSDSNSAFGDQALYTLTSGNNNTAVGRKSLFLATGSENTALGSLAGDDLTTEDNCLLLGYNSKIGSYGSNTIVLGNSSHTKCYIEATELDITDIRADKIGAKQHCILLQNNNGAQLTAGTIVKWESGGGFEYNISNPERYCGVVAETIADGATGMVSVQGPTTLITDGSIACSIGDKIYVHSTASTPTQNPALGWFYIGRALSAQTGIGTVLVDLNKDYNNDYLIMREKSAQISANAGEGIVWVKNDNPSFLAFTDDNGDDTFFRKIWGQQYFRNQTSTFNVNTTGAEHFMGGRMTESVKNISQVDGSEQTAITAFADAGGGEVTVSSASTPLVNQYVSISGTTNYNAIYEVISVSAGVSFNITETFAGDDATGFWNVGDHFIADYSGDYEITSNLSCYNAVGTCLIVLSIYANDTLLTSTMQSITNTRTDCINAGTIVSLSAGDIVSLSILNGTSSNNLVFRDCQFLIKSV